MRYTIEQTADGWVLHCGDDEPVTCSSRTDALAKMMARAAADDDAAALAAAEEVAAAEVVAEMMPAEEPGGGGAMDEDMPATMAEARMPERWVSGPSGACMKAMTGPERDFSACAFSWRPLPLPLMVQTENAYGHDEAEWGGMVDTITMRQDGGLDMGGYLFANDAGEQARLIMMGAGQAGCSVDPSEYVTAEFVCTEMDDDGWCMEGVTNFTAYEVAGLTIVPFPGFQDAYVTLEGQAAVMASADVVAAPRDWFYMPEPEDGSPLLVRQAPSPAGDDRWAVPLTVTDDGRVYGHLAAHGTCHIGYAGQCVQPPLSPSGYAHFHLGTFVTADGERVPVGSLVVGLDHALHTMRAPAARDHYAHTGLAWADVRMVDGLHGIWVCGTLRPDVTADQLKVIRASSLSGDWRDIGGELELVAAQLVTTPGFPITREAIAASAWELPTVSLTYRQEAGRLVSLAAAGLVTRAEEQVDALVAAGTIAPCTDCAGRTRTRRRPEQVATLAPADRALLDLLTARVGTMHDVLAILEQRTRPLVAGAVAEVRARLIETSVV